MTAIKAGKPSEENGPVALSGAVLAGGGSRRFGQDKARAVLRGKTLISYVLGALQSLFEDVLIVTNQPLCYESFDATVVSDIVRGAGSLGGLLTALVHAREERCFVVACDMPFLSAPVIRRMVQKCGGYDVTVPVLKGELQPLHAIYSKRCIAHILTRMEERDYRIFNFYPKVSTLRLEESVWEGLDPGNLSFANINTPQELKRAERWLRDMKQGVR